MMTPGCPRRPEAGCASRIDTPAVATDRFVVQESTEGWILHPHPGGRAAPGADDARACGGRGFRLAGRKSMMPAARLASSPSPPPIARESCPGSLSPSTADRLPETQAPPRPPDPHVGDA